MIKIVICGKSGQTVQREIVSMSLFSHIILDLIGSCCPVQVLHLLRDAAKRRVFDTATCITKSSNRSVVRPAGELLLHGLGQGGAVDVRVLWSLGGELAVEVFCVTSIQLGSFVSY